MPIKGGLDCPNKDPRLITSVAPSLLLRVLEERLIERPGGMFYLEKPVV
jgi:hypothetical protein